MKAKTAQEHLKWRIILSDPDLPDRQAGCFVGSLLQ